MNGLAGGSPMPSSSGTRTARLPMVITHAELAFLVDVFLGEEQRGGIAFYLGLYKPIEWSKARRITRVEDVPFVPTRRIRKLR